MGIILGLICAGAAAGFALFPLIRRGTSERFDLAEDDLLVRRDAALTEIRDIDFDHDLGNLAEGDYQELRDQSKRQAVDILKRLNAREAHIDDEIEKAVAALRGGS
jgi:hypothetical protein